MKRLIPLALLFALFDAAAQNEACHQRANALKDSGQINYVQRGEMRRDCDRATFGADPIREEYWAYWIYLSAEVDSGRMGSEQARYLILQKENELNDRRRNQILQLLPLQPQPTYRPVVPPRRGPVQTNCYSDSLGNTTCTTQ